MVKRYELSESWGVPELSEYDHGEWVSFEDYEKLEQKYDSLRNAAAELLEYAEDNRPHSERESWLGLHPIDELGKLLSE